MYDPVLGACVPRILYLVKFTSFQSSEQTWKYFRSLVKMRCSISFPPAPKRSYINRLVIPAKDFPAAALLSMRSNVLSNAASFLNAHAVQYGLFLYRAAVLWCFVPIFSKFAQAAVSNTARLHHRSALVGIMP